MALSELEAYEQALIARAVDEALRAQARASAAANGTVIQITDGVFRAIEGGSAYQVTGVDVVELTTGQADDLVETLHKGGVAADLDSEETRMAESAARCRQLALELGPPLGPRLNAEANILDQLAASHALLVTDLGGVPAPGMN